MKRRYYKLTQRILNRKPSINRATLYRFIVIYIHERVLYTTAYIPFCALYQNVLYFEIYPIIFTVLHFP